jgi:hypothetical protein
MTCAPQRCTAKPDIGLMPKNSEPIQRMATGFVVTFDPAQSANSGHWYISQCYSEPVGMERRCCLMGDDDDEHFHQGSYDDV